MSSATTIDATQHSELASLESHLKSELGGRVRNLRLMNSRDGIVLHGVAHSYHAKQLAQHTLMQATQLPIAANQIEVV
jgi:hypothetical protein